MVKTQSLYAITLLPKTSDPLRKEIDSYIFSISSTSVPSEMLFSSAGNILIKRSTSHWNRYYSFTTANCICDFGLSQPANISSSVNSSGIFGVVPYTAPEIFRGKPYTPASDIYSLGIIIWTIHSLEQPYSGRCHDAKLIIDIIGGLRPEISSNMGMANFCVELVKKCWDPDPINRPTADQIIRTYKRRIS